MNDENDNFNYAYTDGACLGNPGPGGWGVYGIIDKEEPCWRGGESRTTNQRMELTAAIRAVELMPSDKPLIVYTDSQYVQQGITNWIHKWKQNSWRSSSGKPVANRDLWETLDSLVQDRAIVWKHVRGHSGNYGNERADNLAQLAAIEASRTGASAPNELIGTP